MSQRLRRVAAAVLVGVGVLGASLGDTVGASTGSLIGGAHPVTATITIDSNNTFAAPQAHAKPKLSAITAWRRYTRSHGHRQRRPHAGIKIWIGLFTSNHEVSDKLAYGYEGTKPQRCITTLPAGKPRRCRVWDFVNANTGYGLGSRFQVVKAP